MYTPQRTIQDTARGKSARRVGALATGLCVTALLLGLIPTESLRAAPQDVDEDARFTVGRVHYGGGGDWYSDPTSMPNLLEAVGERTSVATTERERNVKLTDETLYRTPFLYLTGHGNISFTESEVDRLRDFLTAGGFMWADDNYGMDPHFRSQMARVFPDRSLVELPFDHPIYHVLYDFDGGPPKIHEHDGKPPQGFGIFHEGRLVVFYTYESDIGDGLEDPSVHDTSPEKHEAATRMATNIVLYSLMH